ncbi:MAG TPA: hypothetical protein VK831_05920 [Candidatus Deferrimicrobiaceae bacterium]|nr:hypothetical protein [Candidatus Deferrimicrobiaceae bacterium]
MPNEFYFMGLGGLGVSLAGFAGLISALDRRPEGHTPVAAWRIRNIVMGGFAVTFAGFGTVALYTVTSEDLTLTVRLASLLLGALTLAPMPWEARPGPAWPDDRHRQRAVTFTVVLAVAELANVAVGSLGYLQVLFLMHLGGPVSIFANTVRDVAREASARR